MSKRFQRVIASMTMTATTLSLSSFAILAPIATSVAQAVTPADYGLTEGDVIRGAGDIDVYIVNEHGYKRLFVNPAIFNLYGHLGFSKVKEVAPATRDAFGTSGLFRNCESGDQKVYGLDVVSEDVANLRWVNTSGAQAVADDANFFKKVFCINNAEQGLYGTGADYTSVTQVPDYSRSTTPTGPFGASIAFDNPASTTLLEEQSFADLARFSVTGSGKVTTLTLNRLGISGDDTLANVYLFVNGYRVSDGNTFSNNTLTFNDANGFFNAPATVAVRANVANGTSGKTVGVKLTMVNTSTVNASGNIHSIAAENNDLSDISIGSAAGGGSLDPQADVTLWQGDLSSGVNDVWFKRLTLRMVGSAAATDFSNFRLLIDGVQVATSAGIDSNDYVTFLGNKKILTSDAGLLKVVGDIVGGPGKTYKFELRGSTTLGSYDIELVDADYNAGVPPVTGTFPFGPASGTIGAASLTIVKATDSPSGDVVLTTDDFTLAKYTFTAYGEPVKIENLVARASISAAAVANLRDGRILINGTQYGSTQVLPDATSVSFTVNYTLQPGSPATVEIRADAKENSGTALANGDVVSAVLETGVDNAQGLSSGDVLDAPSSDLEGNNRSVVTGSLSLAKDNSYANQTLVPPTGSIKLGDYVLTGSNTEGANITSFTVTVDEVTGTTNENEMRDIFVKYGSQQTTVRSTVNATQDFSVNFSVGVNQVVPVEVWAQILNTASTSNHTFKTTLDLAGTTTPSGSTVSVNATDGQTHTIGAGSFTGVRDTSVANTDMIVGDESSVTAVGYEFTAVNENYKISRLNLTMPNSSGINEVRILDGGSLVMSLPASVGMTFNISSDKQPLVSPSQTKKLTVELVLATIASPGGGASGANHTVTLVAANSKKIAQSSGVESAFTGSNIVGKAVYVYKAVPTVTRLALPSTALANGTRTLAKFNIGAGGTGTIGWSKAVLAFSATGGVAFTSTRVYDASNESVALTGTVASSGGNITFTSSDELPAGDYVVKATVYGATGDDSINVGWNQSGLGFVAPTASASVGATAATLVWTDRFSLPHTELTPDWNNDNLVKNLPVDSWAQSD